MKHLLRCWNWKWKGNIAEGWRESKKGTVLELSLEVRRSLQQFALTWRNIHGKKQDNYIYIAWKHDLFRQVIYNFLNWFFCRGIYTRIVRYLCGNTYEKFVNLWGEQCLVLTCRFRHKKSACAFFAFESLKRVIASIIFSCLR